MTSATTKSSWSEFPALGASSSTKMRSSSRRRKSRSPQSAPVAAPRPLPPPGPSRFGTIDTPCSPPPDSAPRTEARPKQPGRFGVAVGVPIEERVLRRTAARRPLSTAHDIEDDWTGDARWNFGVIGTFDRRRSTHPTPMPSPRARGRGRGIPRGRGRGYTYRGSPAEQDFALPAPIDPYNPYAFNPYTYPSYVPVPPMWTPYTYGMVPPPPMPAGGAAPPPVPVTNVGYMLDPMRYYVLGQVEYYFSIQNMCQDLYLRQQMDAQGWIPIATICSFNRLRKLTQDVHLVREMMHLSSLVEVSADAEKARMAGGVWATFVLPDAQDAEGDVSVAGGTSGTSVAGGTSPPTSMDVPEEKSALGLVGVDN